MTRYGVSWAAPGRATAAAVAGAVRTLQAGRPLSPVLVITPPGATATSLRRLLPSVSGLPGVGTGAQAGGAVRGIAGIRFTTLPDLALDLAPAAVRRQRPISPLLLTAAVHDELTTSCPPVLQGVSEHPATVDALVRAADRLGALTLSEDDTPVRAALARGSEVRRAIIDVAIAARRRVLADGFRDEARVIAAASAALGDGSAAVPAPVVLVVTDALHPAHLPLLQLVLRQAPGSAVVAAPPVEGDDDLAAQLGALCGLAVDELPRTERATPLDVVSCPDGDEEARYVVRRIVAAVTGAQPASLPEDHVVLYPPGTGYARSLRDELERAGLHASGPPIEVLAASTAGQALRLIIDMFHEGCDRERLLHLVAVAPQWPAGEGRPRNAQRWRRLCRQAGVVTSADWSTAVDRLAAAQLDRRERQAVYDASIDPGQPTPRDQSDLDSMGRLVSLAAHVQRTAGAYRQARSWVEAVDALSAELVAHIGTAGWREEHWADAPAWQRRAGEQVATLLAALVQFDDDATRLTFGRGTLRRIVETELDRPVRRTGDAGLGVRVLPLTHAVCVDAAHLYVVGANDGVLPPRRVDDLVVGRDLPASCTGFVEHADWQRHRLHRAWQAALHGDAPVTVTYARSDLRRGGELYPSLWLAGAAATEHASHAAGVRHMAPLTAAEAAAARSAPELLAASPILQRRAIALASRVQPGPTPFDAFIGAHAEHDPTSSVQAITYFEGHAGSALRYFAERVLRIDTGTDPSEITEIEALDKGNVMHRALERLVAEWLELADRPPWLQGAHLDLSIRRIGELLDEEAEELRAANRLGNTNAWQIERRLILAALEATLRAEAAEGLTPLAVEYSFGFPDSPAPPLAVPVEGLGTVRFRGRVDRVDRTASGLLVTDFKSSRAASKRNYPRADVESGVKLQLPLYARVLAANALTLLGDADAGASARYVYLRRDRSEPVPPPDDIDEVVDLAVARTARRVHAGDFRADIPGDFGCIVTSPDDLGLGDVAARANVLALACPLDTVGHDSDGDPA